MVVPEHRGRAHQVTTDYINCAWGYKQTAPSHPPCAFSLPLMTLSCVLRRMTSPTREGESHDKGRLMYQTKWELVKRWNNDTSAGVWRTLKEMRIHTKIKPSNRLPICARWTWRDSSKLHYFESASWISELVILLADIWCTLDVYYLLLLLFVEYWTF